MCVAFLSLVFVPMNANVDEIRILFFLGAELDFIAVINLISALIVLSSVQEY